MTPEDAQERSGGEKKRAPVSARWRVGGVFALAAVLAVIALGTLSVYAFRLAQDRDLALSTFAAQQVAETTAGVFQEMWQQAMLVVRTHATTTLLANLPLQEDEALTPPLLVRRREASSGEWEVLWRASSLAAGYEERPSRWIPLREGSVGFSDDGSTVWVRVPLATGEVWDIAFSSQLLISRLASIFDDETLPLEGVRLLTPDGTVLFSYGVEAKGPTLAPIVFRRQLATDVPIVVAAYHSPSLIDQMTDTYRLGAALVVVSVATLLGVGLLLLQRLVFAPLGKLAAVAQEVGKGNFAVSVPSVSVAELQPLAHAMDRMLRYVNRYNEALVAKLQRTIAEQDRSARLLLRRDLELQEANERLRELDRQKSEFVSIAAHQLRTPLSAVRWALSLVLGGDYGPLTPAQRSVLERAKASNAQMIALVNDLLDVDRIESGRTVFHWEEADVCELVDEEIRNHLAKARDAGVSLALAIEVRPCPKARLDKRLFAQAVRNIVENAIKYTPKGGSVTVRLAPASDPASLILEVRDTGIGIPKEAQKQLFTRFFRAPNAMLRQTEGSGLGLYLVKRILERMHCAIAIESEEGKGTTVRIIIPILHPRTSKA